MPFELGAFVRECGDALASEHPQKNVREAVARAVSDKRAVTQALGEPSRAAVMRLHESAELTILHVVWAPKMTFLPHDHTMWAVIGVYAGREDNIFWKRTADGSARVEAAGAKSLSDRDAVILGPDIIHSVTNPIPRLTGALHVYGGDFFNAQRREWDPETLVARAYDANRLARELEAENKRWSLGAVDALH